MRENQLQKKCIKLAEDSNVLAYKTISPGRRGFPDVLLVFKGENKRYVLWEEIEAILNEEEK